MILSEYLTNKNRKVFKGYAQQNITKKDCFYVTYNIKYAYQYSGENGYIDQFNLKKGINLFNPRFKKDWEKYKKYCIKNKLFKFLVPLETLANEDWLEIWNWEEREEFIQILKKLNYEGFVNYEGEYGSIKVYGKEWNEYYNQYKYTFTGVGIFKLNFLKKEKTFKGYEEFLTIDVFKRAYEFEKNQLIKEIYKLCKNNNYKDISNIIDKINYDKYLILNQKEILNVLNTFNYQKIEEKIKLLEEKRRKITKYKLSEYWNIPLNKIKKRDIDNFLNHNF